MSQVNRARKRIADDGISWLNTLSEAQIMDLMEARIVKLELATEKILERLSAVERDIAVIRSNYATKADIAALQASITALEAKMLKRFVTTAISLAGLTFTLAGVAVAAAKFIH
ncbi:MAG TPA: hypothetical protein VF800_09165 [Telluria sp.]